MSTRSVARSCRPAHSRSCTNNKTPTSRTVKHLAYSSNTKTQFNTSLNGRYNTHSRDVSTLGYRKISIYDSTHNCMVSHLQKTANNSYSFCSNAAEPVNKMVQYIQAEISNIKRINELKKYDLVSAIENLPASQYRRDGYLNSASKGESVKKSSIYTRPTLTRSHITGLPGSNTSIVEKENVRQVSMAARNLETSAAMNKLYGYKSHYDIGSRPNAHFERTRYRSKGLEARALNTSTEEYDLNTVHRLASQNKIEHKRETTLGCKTP